VFDAASLFKDPITHRGLHDKSQGRVENCESSFQAAIDAGFAIECDVRMSEDNQVVVFHDDTLGRLTQNASTVRDLSVAELKKVPFNDGPDRIQTLNELLEQVSEKVPLIIELKSQWDGDLGLALRVAETIGTYFGPVATMSFDPALVKEAQRWLPHVPNGIVAEHYQDTEEWRFLSRFQRFKLSKLLHWPQTKPDFISYNINDLPSWSVSLFENLMSVPTICWTVRTAEQAARAAEICDQITFEGFDPRSTP